MFVSEGTARCAIAVRNRIYGEVLHPKENSRVYPPQNIKRYEEKKLHLKN
jgi:hypothetical protein